MSYRVLIADDEPLIQGFIGKICQELGWSVDIASDGEQAVDLMRRHPHEIFVIDVVMPPPSGLELARLILNYETAPAILILTGFAEVDQVVQAMKEGVFNYVQKDLHLGEIKAYLMQAAQYHEDLLLRIREKQQQEAEYREIKIANEQFRTILEFCSDMIFIVEAGSGRILEGNQSTCRQLGYDSAELLQLRISDIDPNVTLSSWKEFVEQTRQQNFWTMESFFRKKDGTPFPVEVSNTLVRLEEHEFLLKIARDITERKRFETALAFERDLLHTLLNNSTDCIYFKDSESRFIRINRALARLWGLKDPEEAVGKTDFDFMPANAQQLFQDEQDILQFRKPIISQEVKLTTKQGETHWFSETKVAIKNQKGKAVGLVGISRDITQRKLVEIEIEQAKKQAETESVKLRALIEGMEEGILVTDEQGTVTEVNSWFSNLLKTPKELILGQNLSTLVREKIGLSVHPILEAFHSNTTTEKVSLQEKIEELSVLLHFQPIMQEGRFKGTILNLIDVSELMASQETAEEGNRFKSEMLSKISYEFRTPLDGILGMIQLALNTPLDEEQRALLDMAQECGNSLVSLIGELEDLSKIESGILQYELQEFDLRSFLAEILASITQKVSYQNIHIRYEIDNKIPPTVSGYPEPLTQILNALLEDAVKTIDDDSFLLSVNEQKRTASDRILRFTLSGEKQQAEYGGDALYLQEKITVGDYPGTDTRVSLLRELQKIMKGKLGVESLHNQIIRLFFQATFSLPKAETKPSIEALSSPVDLHVLIVDDSRMGITLASQYVRNQGCRVSLAQNGKEALSRLKEEAFDLVFMDIEMPEMDGLEATRKIRRESGFESVPIIAMIAHVTEAEREKCLEAGMNDFLTKPLNPADIQSMIAKWKKKSIRTDSLPPNFGNKIVPGSAAGRLP